MRGRKPAHPNVVQLKGNPGRRPVRDVAPAPEGMPEPPHWMSGEALAEWHRIGPQWARLKVLTPLDRGVFASYCQAWAAWSEAEAKIGEYGRMVLSPKGAPVPNPWLPIAREAYSQMIKSASEIGLTPSARVRVKASAEENEDPAESYFSAG